MESKIPSIRYIGLKYGAFTAAAFIAYFLIMYGLGLVRYTELRFLNYIFLPVGIWMGLSEVRRRMHKHRVSYLPGLGTGLLITGVTSFLFSVFIWIYSGLNPHFTAMVRPSLPFSDYVNPMMLAEGAFGETFIFGVVFSFVIMQFFKRNRESEFEEYEEEAEKKPFKKEANEPGLRAEKKSVIGNH